MASDVNVRKVKPYPFKATLKDARGAFVGQIVKLTLQGLMIEVAGSAVQPGEKVELSFVTPVLNGTVVAAGVVIKVYNQMVGGHTPAGSPPGTASSIHLIEIHFKSVPSDSLSHIAMFLESTGQAKRS